MLIPFVKPDELVVEVELLITDFNQIEIEKALTAKMRRIIWLLYVRLESVAYCQVRCYSAAHLSDNCFDGRTTQRRAYETGRTGGW